MSSNEEDVFMSYVRQILFLGILGLIILWCLIILASFAGSFGQVDKDATNPASIDERLKAIEVVNIKEAPKPVEASAADAPAVDAGAIDANAIVTATCAACHGTGLLESPKIGDKTAWEARLVANGDLDGLVKSAIAGKGAMPARGGNAALSDAEIKAAVEFMMQ